MITESYLSNNLTGLKNEELDNICNNLLNIYPKVKIEKEDYKLILDLLIFDKKNEAGKILFVLLNQIGEAKFNCEVPTEMLHSSLDFYNNL